MFLPPLFLLVFAWQQSPQKNPTTDALALLNEVSQRYADAKSYHIEAVEERTTTTDLSRSWYKTLYTAIVMSDGRYRYEGRSGYGAAVVVFDGKMQSIYHLNDHRYIQRAAAKYPQKGQIIPHEENAAFEATALMATLAKRAHRLKSATQLPDEIISIGGSQIDCYVVRYSTEDFKTRNNDTKQEFKLWIDKSRKLVIKATTSGETYMITDTDGRIPMREETTLTYPIVQLDQEEPASSFAFNPPADAELVSEFPGRWKQAGSLVGKQAPEAQFNSGEKSVALRSFRGKPVFIEFWATWCGPCVDILPDLAKLYSETRGKGLVWISVDNDEDAADVAAYLSKKHLEMPWANYHDADGSLGKAFHRNGIPLGVLIDAEGKITFQQSGYDISDLRAAIAKLGPKFSALTGANVSSN